MKTLFMISVRGRELSSKYFNLHLFTEHQVIQENVDHRNIYLKLKGLLHEIVVFFELNPNWFLDFIRIDRITVDNKSFAFLVIEGRRDANKIKIKDMGDESFNFELMFVKPYRDIILGFNIQNGHYMARDMINAGRKYFIFDNSLNIGELKINLLVQIC